MKTNPLAIMLIATALLAVACQDRDKTATEPAVAAPVATVIRSEPADIATREPAVATTPADHWLGMWTGPEGTFLQLAKEDDHYLVTIQSLDGPATYRAAAVGDHMEFDRDGAVESIHATAGKETGMKWLLDKHDCLTVKLGEGFCRD